MEVVNTLKLVLEKILGVHIKEIVKTQFILKTKIHVNQHHIRSNKTKNTDLPVITIKQGRKNTYCNEVEILGPSRIIYCGSGDEKPLLSCGARVVIETESEIKIIS
jgi:hypothetical protein